MAEDVETVSAESSTAETKPAEIAIPTDPKAYAEWRQTGKLPSDDKPSKGEDSATSKNKSDDEESEKAAPVSETGKSQGRNAETRIKQLAAERDQYKAKLEALETGRKDAPAESSPAPAKDVKAASSTAPAASTEPVEPNQDDFDDWGSYEIAKKAHFKALARWEARQIIEEERQAQRQDEMGRQMETRLNEAKARYGDEAETKILETAHSVFDDSGVVQPVKQAIGRSKVMVDALYVLGSDPAEFKQFIQLSHEDPLEAIRKWFTVEELVKQELSKAGSKPAAGETPARGNDGKFLPAKKSLPAPPVELNGNSSPPGDQSERAASTGNFSAFKADRDRKDLLKYKGL